MDLVKDKVRGAWKSSGNSTGSTWALLAGVAAAGLAAGHHHRTRDIPWTAQADFSPLQNQGQPVGLNEQQQQNKQQHNKQHGAEKGAQKKKVKQSLKKKKKSMRSLRDSFDDLFDDVELSEKQTSHQHQQQQGGSSGDESVLESEIDEKRTGGRANSLPGLLPGVSGFRRSSGPASGSQLGAAAAGGRFHHGVRSGSRRTPTGSNRRGSSQREAQHASLGNSSDTKGAGDAKGAAAAASQKSSNAGTGGARRGRVAVDAVFFRRLFHILRICVPSILSKETAFLAIYSVLLVSRTFFSMAISELSGYNAEMLVKRNWPGLMRGIRKFALVTIPTACVNSGLKYVQQVVALSFRARLTTHVNAQYIRGVNFYKACNLGGDSRIDSADQRVTSDIEKFTTAVSELYSTMFKPTLDVIMFTSRLRQLLGWQGPAMMYGYFIASGILKKFMMPPLGRLAATESALEGQYRTAHQRLIVNSEEVALYEGARTERAIINQLFRRVRRHTGYVVYVRAWVNFVDGLLIKYWATIVGYAVMASPMIFKLEDKLAGKDSGALTADYIRNTSYLMGLAAAIGQIVLVGNKMTNVAGYTARVSELLEMVKRLDQAGLRPFEVQIDDDAQLRRTRSAAARAVGASAGSASELDSEFEHERLVTHSDAALQVDWVQQWHARREQQKKLLAAVVQRRQQQHGSSALLEKRIEGGGVIRIGDKISFENVDLVSPDGKMLAEKLTFEVKHGENVMVTGPNGSGKSSLSRLIGELWPLQNGEMTKPTFSSADTGSAEVMFVPQKPYMVLGTLRDQLIYPHTRHQTDRLQVTDSDLQQLLDIVDPNRIITTSWEFDEIRDWVKTFSGGQRQRISMARLFYHKPRFAVLDECTNAMSEEIEDKMYEAAKALRISLFTVSHRVSLQRHHEWQLTLHGNGKWDFHKADHTSASKGSHSY